MTSDDLLDDSEDEDEDEGDTEDAIEDDFENDGSPFSCPFCGGDDEECGHFLGSRDLHFCGPFSLEKAGPLAELRDLFDTLGLQVEAFVAAGKRKARIAALKPRRLRHLVQAAADGSTGRGFTCYVEQVGRDTKIGVASNSYEEAGSPGFCSVIQMYWSRNVPAAVGGIKQRVAQDIRRLQKSAASEARDNRGGK